MALLQELINQLDEDENLTVYNETFSNETVINKYLPDSTFYNVHFFKISFKNSCFARSKLTDCVFTECNFDRANFRKVDHFNTCVENCYIKESTIIGSQFMCGKFKDTTFERSNLIALDLNHFEIIDSKFKLCALNFISAESIEICNLGHTKKIQGTTDLGTILDPNYKSYL